MEFAKQLALYAAAFCIGLVGWVLNVSQLYWMAATLLVLPGVSRTFGRLEHRGLALSREAPTTGHQGEAVEVRFRVANHWMLPKLNLALNDDLPAGLSAMPASVPVQIAPRGAEEATYSLQLRRRGLHVIPSIRLESVDPLGLRKIESRHTQRSEVLVYPRVAPIPAHLIPPTTGGGRAPLETAQRQGEGSSFMGVREYRPGDPLRHVHWRTAARLGRLAVVEWEAEESVDAVLAVETHEGSEHALGHSTTLDLAAGLAASLAAKILATGDSVRLLAPGTTEWRPNPDLGMGALPGLLESLARMQAISPHSLAAELTRVAPQFATGTLIAWLTPHLDAAVVETARTLRGARLRPYIYLLADWPAAQAHPSAELEAALRSYGVPVLCLHPEDELVRRLLD